MQKFLAWAGSAGDVWAVLAAFGAGLMVTIALASAYLSWPPESQLAMALAIGLVATRTVPPVAAAIRMIATAIGQKLGLPVRSVPLLREAESTADQLRANTIKGSAQPLFLRSYRIRLCISNGC